METEFVKLSPNPSSTAILRRLLEHIGLGTPERRGSRRFPIRCKLQFKTSDKRSAIFVGNGQTLNISSSGVLVQSDCDLPVGERVELFIDWPVQLNEKCGLKLVTEGIIIRRANREFAVDIIRYEFRTQAASPAKDSNLF
jgi:PilZ domain